jgi:hypothetical protein
LYIYKTVYIETPCNSDRPYQSNFLNILTPFSLRTPYTTLLLIPTSNPNGFLKNPSLVSNPRCLSSNS